mmetsp:Transcript_15650/g.20063  ORF Transcript_15650/g.20063 Transcript_15650/m.20063 type:complete len:445 (-) Transcript_15650:39-1373(-)
MVQIVSIFHRKIFCIVMCQSFAAQMDQNDEKEQNNFVLERKACLLEGKIICRRLLGRIGFCTISISSQNHMGLSSQKETDELTLIFKKEHLTSKTISTNEQTKVNSNMPKKKSELPLDKMLSAECFEEEEENGGEKEMVVKFWRILDCDECEDWCKSKEKDRIVSNQNVRPRITGQKEASEARDALCRPWTLGTCSFADRTCPFRHWYNSPEEAASAMRHRKRRAQMQKISAAELQEYHQADPHSNESKRSKTERARVFCEWLIETYGADYLYYGSGVIDVAGGKGHIALELSRPPHCIPVTVIDPYVRPGANLTKIDGLCTQIPVLFDDNFVESQEGKTLLKNASIIIGMHPDEVTEYIVDIALAFKKPFAVVPCCVFSDLFPNRQLKSGEKVKSTLDLAKYLVQKDSSNVSCHLNFCGRNLCVFQKPENVLPAHNTNKCTRI